MTVLLDDVPSPEMKFGDKIRSARLDKMRMSIRDAAAKIGISPSYLSCLENNTNDAVPSEEVIRKLSSTLKIPYAELVELAKEITTDLRALHKKCDEKDIETIKAFYRIIRKYNLSPKKVLRDIEMQYEGKNG